MLQCYTDYRFKIGVPNQMVLTRVTNLSGGQRLLRWNNFLLEGETTKKNAGFNTEAHNVNNKSQ